TSTVTIWLFDPNEKPLFSSSKGKPSATAAASRSPTSFGAVVLPFQNHAGFMDAVALAVMATTLTAAQIPRAVPARFGPSNGTPPVTYWRFVDGNVRVMRLRVRPGAETTRSTVAYATSAVVMFAMN